MKIDREQVIGKFKAYTSAYDVSDEKIRLKIYHTYRVAGLCERIAKSEGMPQEEADLAWLLGMLHDIGRFEQLKRYGTFIDAESVDHAALGADILFGGDCLRIETENQEEQSSLNFETEKQEGQGNLISETEKQGEQGSLNFETEKREEQSSLNFETENVGCIREFVIEDGEDRLIEMAIRVHSAYRIPENLDKRTEKFCHILRDADKIDILRVNVEVPLEEIYNTTTEELRNASVTPEVEQSFYEHHAVLRSLKKTPADHVVGHGSLVFELVFPESLRIVKQQGYLEKLLHFETENPKTREQFAGFWKEMESYLGQEG